MANIVVKFKDSVIKELPVDRSEIKIGRHPDNDIHIDNPAVSGFHARIVNYRDGLYIEDLNSLNGTFLNDKKVGRAPLKNKDAVTVGKHVLILMGEPPADLAPMEPVSSNLEATMVLDTKKQKELMEKSGAVAKAAKEVLGGFTVIEGSADKPEYELAGRLSTIGKADNSTIKLKGLFAPKVGALVNRTKEGYAISPPGGGAKIKINGKSVEGRQMLKDGDIVEVSNIKLQFFIKE